MICSEDAISVKGGMEYYYYNRESKDALRVLYPTRLDPRSKAEDKNNP